MLAVAILTRAGNVGRASLLKKKRQSDELTDDAFEKEIGLFESGPAHAAHVIKDRLSLPALHVTPPSDLGALEHVRANHTSVNHSIAPSVLSSPARAAKPVNTAQASRPCNQPRALQSYGLDRLKKKSLRVRARPKCIASRP